MSYERVFLLSLQASNNVAESCSLASVVFAGIGTKRSNEYTWKDNQRRDA